MMCMQCYFETQAAAVLRRTDRWTWVLLLQAAGAAAAAGRAAAGAAVAEGLWRSQRSRCE